MRVYQAAPQKKAPRTAPVDEETGAAGGGWGARGRPRGGVF